MNTGKIKSYNTEKGFGFVNDDETGQNYFFHASGLIDEVKENDKVSFKVTEGRKGLQAVDVKLI